MFRLAGAIMIKGRNRYVSAILLLVIFSAFAGADSSTAVDPNNNGRGLFELPFEEVMDMEVISVTRTKGQNVFTSPAAIYVITQEDIRRSGLRSIPELLRLAPGVQVSRIRADQWAISIRGFTERFSDKLLVQIDGRTIYNMVFSGVLWEIQDYVLEDIERIEVIRGPGASLWGANAVNGIINIITKKAKDTQGGYFNGGGGNFDAIGSLRYGGKAGENGYWRAWGKHKASNDYPSAEGDFTDDYGLTTMGFRYDWDGGTDDTYTVELGGFDGRFSLLFPNIDVSAGTDFIEDTVSDQYGGNIRGRWEHQIDSTSSTMLQAYVNINSFTIPEDMIDFRSDWNLFDIDFQHDFMLGEDNSFVWGIGYRNSNFDSRGSEKISYRPSSSNFDMLSGFVQDCFPIFSDRLRGVVGVKLLDNDFTGFEYQPTARMMYQYSESQVFWAAYSRAVRLPNYANRDLFLNRKAVAPSTALTIEGNKDIHSERVNSYEAGWRSLVSKDLTLDVTGYIMNSDDIGDFVEVEPLMRQYNNTITANTEGVEVAADWQVSESWRLKGTYSWIHLHITRGAKGLEDNTPKNMFSINSYKNFSRDIEFNTNIFFQDKIEQDSDNGIADWLRFDAGLVWHVNKDTDIGLWGQNLTDSRHQEFNPGGFINVGSSEIPRSIFVQMTHKF